MSNHPNILPCSDGKRHLENKDFFKMSLNGLPSSCSLSGKKMQGSPSCLPSPRSPVLGPPGATGSGFSPQLCVLTLSNLMTCPGAPFPAPPLQTGGPAIKAWQGWVRNGPHCPKGCTSAPTRGLEPEAAQLRFPRVTGSWRPQRLGPLPRPRPGKGQEPKSPT